MSIFDEVKAAVSIRQAVEFYGYKVNRAGQFLCPFHPDHKPSASIKHDYFNCFVCGAGGDVISFTAKLFGLSNFEACKKLINDFHLSIEVDKPLTPLQRLRADREHQKRVQEQRDREQMDALVRHTGLVLADYFRYLWQGKEMYPITDKRHLRALQELSQAEYYLQCYDENPKEYSIEARKQVNRIERKLYRWNNEGQ